MINKTALDDGAVDLWKNSNPRVVISSCLGFEKCRYDASGVESAAVRDILSEVNPIPVCPEIEMGLSIPRDPICVVLFDRKARLIQPFTGMDLTSNMIKYSLKFLQSIPLPDGFIMKSKSPSCGIGGTKIFDNPDDDIPVAFGDGFFVKAVKVTFPLLAIESEETLKNPLVKREFMRRIRASVSSREK